MSPAVTFTRPALPQPHPRPLAVLLDEDHAGGFEPFAKAIEVERRRPRRRPLFACFKSEDGLFAHANARGQLRRGPAEELASSSDLPRREGRFTHRCWR